jgi:MFS family permease
MSKNHSGIEAPVPRLARVCVSLIFFLNGTVMGTWATRIPAIQAKLGINPGELGLALLGASIGALVGLNLSGYLAARFGSRSVTTIAGLCLFLILPLLALVPSLPALVVALVLFGACNGSMDVAMNTQGVAVERRYGKTIFNSFHACYSLGALFGALIGGFVASLNVALLLHFLGVALICALLILGSARFLLPGREDAQKTETKFVWPTRTVLALGLIAFCALVGEGAIGDWSALYLNGTLRTGAGLAAAGFAAFSIIMALGRGVGDSITARLGPALMVRLGGLIAAAGLTLALVVSWAPLAILGFALVGAGFSVIFPLTLSAAGRTTKQAAGTALAAVATCGYAGFLVGPPVIGFVANALNLRIALGFVVLLSLCAAIFARSVGGNAPTRESLSRETHESSLADGNLTPESESGRDLSQPR